VGAGVLRRSHRHRRARDPERVRGGGVGGSYACADTATGITFALTKNRLTPGFEAAARVAGVVTKAVADS
jgi:hypothetical protein